MPRVSRISALVVGVHQRRRLEVSDTLREAGAIVVEAMTVPQAEAATRQLRFELIFVDFLGACVGLSRFLENLRAEDSEARVFVFSPPVDYHLLAKLQPAGFTKLGFANTRDSVRDVLSAVLDEARCQRNVGRHRPTTVWPR